MPLPTKQEYREDVPLSEQTEEERERLITEILERARTRRQQPRPAWIDKVQSRQTTEDDSNGLLEIIGAWPGNESDEEISVALIALS